ncbi:MAG: aromatic amino acid transport family protein [Microgenomates group bacterium]
MKKSLIYPITTLAGTIIGVGLFSLPYAGAKVGLPILIGWFLVLGALAITIHLFYGEIAKKTPDYKRFPGFVAFHLGKKWQRLAYITTIGGLLGAILAYLIIGGEFLTEICQPIFGGGELKYGTLYFLLGALVILIGVRLIAQIELVGLILFLLILLAIFIKGLPYFKLVNLFPSPDFSQIFLPYGLILFSLWGAALVPEIEEMLKEEKKLLNKVIFISLLIPLIIYLFFVITILGITGKETTPSALPGLKNYLGDGVVTLTLIFGLVTTFTSFISLGLTLKRVFSYDLKIPSFVSWLITCFVPYFFYFIGIKNFISLISFLGAVFLGIDGVLILLMYKKINPAKKNLVYLLSLVFIFGVIYEFIYFWK